MRIISCCVSRYVFGVAIHPDHTLSTLTLRHLVEEIEYIVVEGGVSEAFMGLVSVVAPVGFASVRMC